MAFGRGLRGVDSDDLFLSVLVVGELRHGVEVIRQRGDLVSASNLDAWLRRLAADYGERILPVTTEIAEIWGGFGVTQPVPPLEGLLAATAVYHDLTLVTRNTDDVANTPATTLDPFE